MAHHIVHQLACFILLLAVTSSHKEQTRWSRQISSYTSDISDWVPLNGPVQREPPQSRPPATPIKRQAVAEPRILTEPFPGFARPNGFTQEAFPSRTYFNSPANRQLYLQSVPSAPQNYLTDQGFGQGIRFGLSQPNFPLNQGFVAPQLSFENSPPARAPPKQQLPPSQVQFPKPPPPIQQSKPFINQVPKPTVETTKFVDGYRLENQSNSNFGFNSQKKAQSLQKLKLEAPKTEQIAAKTNPEREEVQLLYVPLESLNRGQFNFRSPVSSPQIINSDLYSLPKLDPLQQTFAADYQRPVAKPIDTFMSSKDYITNYDLFKNFDQVPKFSTVTSPFPTSPPTTPKPKKLKPHQPPLAIFQETKKNANIKVGDVLASLKNANTIAVLDSVNPLNAPKVFIGPSSLIPPENFVKFELPYLSNIENSDKKLRQLPFFVAPLSYNTPNGFAKIPFPSPHVGSVVINSLIKDTPSTIYPTSKFQTTPQHHTTPTVLSTPTAKIISNSYTVAPPHKHERKPDISLNQNYNYYSTGAPKTNAPSKPATQSTYYSLEPQTITALPPSREATSNIGKKQNTGYFLSNVGDQYNSPQFVKFPSQNDDKKQDRTRYYTPVPKSETTTLKTTTTDATTKLSTHSSQLLETHNPYSINQAFHFSTPLDYHSYFDEFKESYAPPPGVNLELPKSSEDPISSTPRQIITTKSEEIVTQKSTQQTSPNYIQNYTPEIHYESEIQNIRYPVYSSDFTTKTGSTSEPHRTTNSANIDITQQINQNSQSHYSENGNIQGYENITETIVNKVTGPAADIDNHGYENSKYENGYESEEIARPNPTTSSTSTTTTTTTSTRRSPIRTRGRPRYTTTPRTESSESITKSTVTRRPLRERRPLPPRSRYEPNKISNDKTTRKPTDSNESTTKSSRTRSRGRIQYKPSGNDEIYEKKNKLQNSKETDLAYQRDILHQNYPVTLMERTSTVDIEAITEPSPKTYYTKTLESGPDIYDTENAYAHQSPAVSQLDEISYKDDVPNYTSRSESSLEYQQSRSSLAPVQQIASHEDSFEKQQEISSHIIPDQKVEKPEVIAYPTESSFSVSTGQPEYSVNHDESSAKQEDTTTSQDIEITKLGSQETTTENEPEENIVQTTPSYNRVRVRPGVIKQYHQASSTESTRSKSERRKPVHAITYRPAFDRRRTTMRIEEIEADLKTKQVHARPEVQDHRHPVYKPDTSTETSASSSTQESFIKRGQFRRRRPSYSTTSTEATSTKKIYEVKNRFRGRRPTEKPTEKPDSQTESSPATVRNTYSSRYSHRPRLSERYNKKPENEPEETEDQDSNYSITRPKYVAPETEQWSPKISSESFKPYNPNDILDEGKLATTERRSDKLQDNIELDIITARNDYDDILISVTPATNNRLNKKIPDIPPTLEALVEQSKITKSESGDNMSTFETMLEEVMKSLEEQDEDEYTSKVTKHKGGEIGEIPPERIIDSGEDIATKQVTAVEGEIATAKPTNDENISAGVKQDQVKSKNRRRGFWKKVKVRPSTESIEVAESQYYSNTVNRLGQSVKLSNAVHEKPNMYEKPKYSVTTYKPSFQFIKDIFSSNEENLSEADALSYVDIPKVNKEVPELDEEIADESKITEIYTTKKTTTVKPTSVGDEDLGTGTPDPTIMDNMYISTPTEPTVSESVLGILDKSEDFSFMDYLFGTTSSDTNKKIRNETAKDVTNVTKPKENVEITTEQTKAKISTTETSYIPDEITTEMLEEDNVDHTFEDIKKISNDKDTKDVETTTQQVKTKTSTVSSFMNPANILSTSMSTEISHETEICFRGKCIKTSKDIL